MSGKYDVQAALSWQEESRQFMHKAGINAANQLHAVIDESLEMTPQKQCTLCGDIEHLISLNDKLVCEKQECMKLALNPCLAACSSCGKECTGFATIVGDKQFCSDCSRAEAHVPHMTAAQQRFHARRHNS